MEHMQVEPKKMWPTMAQPNLGPPQCKTMAPQMKHMSSIMRRMSALIDRPSMRGVEATKEPEDVRSEWTIEKIEEGAHVAGQKRVDAIGKIVKVAGVPFASVVAKGSSTHEGIINAAKKRKCDVIFMASLRRRGLSKLMMGSVTQKVLAHSRIPLVVYR